jgi:hypothetical protein
MSIEKKGGAIVPHRIPGVCGWIEGDVLDIGRRLQEEVDPNLQLGLNKRLNRYEIMYYNKYGKWTLVKVIPNDQPLGDWVIHDLKFGDVQNGKFSWSDLVDAQEKIEEEKDAKRQELFEEGKDELMRKLAHAGVFHKPKLSMYRSNKEKQRMGVKLDK